MDVRYSRSDRVVEILAIALFSSFSINNLNTYGSYILLGITVVTFFYMAIINNGKINLKFSKMHMFVIVFAIFSMISSIWAIRGADAIEKSITLIEILVCITVFYWYFSFIENPEILILRVIMWSGYIVAVYSFVSYGPNNIMYVLLNSGRLSNSFDNVNTLGLICSISIIITFYFILYDKLRIEYIMVVPNFLLLLACGSRKSLVILFVGIFMLYLLKSISEQRFGTIFKLAIFFAIVMIGFSFLQNMTIFSGIGSRMEGLTALISGKGSVDHSTLLREQYAETGIELFKKNPIFGIGMGNAHIMNAAINGEDCYLHNNYVELLANGGIIGFILYYSMYLYLIKDFLSNKRFYHKEIQIAFTILICSLVTDVGVVSYYSKSTYFYMMLLFICLEKCIEREENASFECIDSN